MNLNIVEIHVNKQRVNVVAVLSFVFQYWKFLPQLAVVVAAAEYGYVVRSFGNIKGLLTFEDVKAKLTDGYDAS